MVLERQRHHPRAIRCRCDSAVGVESFRYGDATTDNEYNDGDDCDDIDGDNDGGNDVNYVDNVGVNDGNS